MLKAVTKKRAYEGIVDQIRNLIEKGKLKQGDQLPTESELSATFKVSRSTVREAVLSLETMLLVERRQGDGTYVLASSEEALVQPLAASLVHEKDDVIDTFALRQILEPEIASLAAKNATPKGIAHLEELIGRQTEEIAKGTDTLNADSEIHFALAKMAKNRVLERLSQALIGLLAKTRATYLQTEERKLKSLAGHREVLLAIKKGDAAAARQAMQRHLDDVAQTLIPGKKTRAR